MLSTVENKSGTKGRYIGISFNSDLQEVSSWIGYGCTGKKKIERIMESKEYINKYTKIEPELKNGFEYNPNNSEAVIIRKTIKLADMEDDTFIENLTYLVKLYKLYELKYENAILESKLQNETNVKVDNKTELEKLNIKMIELINQVGELAKEIKELNSRIM